MRRSDGRDRRDESQGDSTTAGSFGNDRSEARQTRPE